MSTTQTVGDSVSFNTANSAGYMPTWIDAANGQRPIKWALDPGGIPITISGSSITTTGSLQGFDPFNSVGRLFYVNSGSGYLPFVGSSINNFHTMTLGSAPGGSTGTVDIPSLYFLIRKHTASANTMNVRAQYSVLGADNVTMNGGSGGLEHCPPRSIPDGMHISAISSGGVVTFAQPTHGFTIGSTVAITLGGTVPVSVDGNYTANIVDSSHATINSWSSGAWSGDGYMFQPGAKLGYLCWILGAGSESMMQMVFQDGEIRNLGSLYFGSNAVAASIDVTKNPYLYYLRAFDNSVSGGALAGAFFPRTRDVGQDGAHYSPPWVNIATGINAAITAFDSRVTFNLTQAPSALTNGNYFTLVGNYAGQDSAGWAVVLDSAGVPVAANPSFGNRPTRFAGIHGANGERKDNLVIMSFHGSYHNSGCPSPPAPQCTPYNGAWQITLQTTMTGPPFDDCATLAPGNILTAAPFPATGPHCTLIQVNSTTPVDQSSTSETLHGQLQIGDIVDTNSSDPGTGEYLRVVLVPDSTHLVVQRQFSSDHYNQSSCAAAANPAICGWSHSIGTVFHVSQGSTDYTTMVYRGDYSALAYWDFLNDLRGLNAADPAGQGIPAATKYFEADFPTASHFDWKDHTFLNDSGGPLSSVNPPGLPSNGKIDGVRRCPTSNQRVGCSAFIVNANPGFSGVAGSADGNGGDQHPSVMSPDPLAFQNDPITGIPSLPFFTDFQTTGVNSDGVGYIAALASGASQVYKLTCNYNADDPCGNKRLPLFVSSGPYTLSDVSAPGRMLADNATDQYHFCIAAVAGECWVGSAAGDRYANIPYAIVHPQTGVFGCAYKEVLDTCAWTLGSHQGAVSQLGMQRQDRLGNDARRLTLGLQTTRKTGGNTRTIPSGDWAMMWMDAGAIEPTMLLAKIGAFPPYSSVNRTDFIPVPVPIAAKAGATTAVVDFGFDENFHCRTRNEGCLANGNATSDPNPFYYPSELPAGKTCSSGCTINIPAISGRIVYYRPRWLDGGGATVETGKTQVVAVP